MDVASRNEMFIYRRINGNVLGDWGSAITHYGYDSGGSISADGYHVYQWDMFVLHERYYNDVSGQFGNCSGYRELRLTHASGITHYQDYWLQSSKVFYTFYIIRYYIKSLHIKSFFKFYLYKLFFLRSWYNREDDFQNKSK